MNDNILGNRIKKFREQLGLTQAQLAKKIGVGATTIANYETAYSTPNPVKIKKLADALGVDRSVFYADDRVDEHMLQQGVSANIIPFYKITNIPGIIYRDPVIRDGYMTAPSDAHRDTSSLICTKLDDNSMANEGLPAGTYIIVDTGLTPSNRDIALAADNNDKRMVVRNCICDGPMITLMANGFGEENEVIQTSIYDTDIKLIGTVVDAIIKVKKY